MESRCVRERKEGEYRFRWDEVTYQPGELRVVTYKYGKVWAKNTARTAREAAGLKISVNRGRISGDGQDLAFVTVHVVDKEGVVVPEADNLVAFEVGGTRILSQPL